MELGYKWCTLEHNMYTRGNREQWLIIEVYMDDLIITSGNINVLNKFKEEILKVFKMSDLGPLSYYLRIEVHQSESSITISQGAYAKKILDKEGLSDSNSCHTQMESRLHLSKSGSTPRVDATHYRCLMGSLRYLVNTRSDLTYSVGYVSRFMEEPREEHLMAVKHILRYIASTKHWGVTYTPGEKGTWPYLIGFSDSDMAGDQNDWKSTSGMIYFLSSNPITWQS
jgi:hypothetical protein